MRMLSPEMCQRIDREIAKYPVGKQQSAVVAALAIVQEAHGHVSNVAMEEVAEYLSMPPVLVYEVATFYTMYRLKADARHQITLCTNLPCALSGANEAAEYLKKTLGVDFGESTDDGRIALREGECMGACGDAPVLLVNNTRMCSKMNLRALEALLQELK